jgi:CO dehydrogenase nickel-insertion accessory protein CooC1
MRKVYNGAFHKYRRGRFAAAGHIERVGAGCACFLAAPREVARAILLQNDASDGLEAPTGQGNPVF